MQPPNDRPWNMRALLESTGTPFAVAGYGPRAIIFLQGDPSDSVMHTLARYFATVRTLGHRRLLAPKLVAEAFGESDIRFVVEVLVPLDKAHMEWRDKTYDGKTERFFKRLLDKHYG